jgi:DnaK suppressor protein
MNHHPIIKKPLVCSRVRTTGTIMASSHFRKILLELRKELASVEIAGEKAAETVELDQTRVGRLSRMDALQNQAISIEVQRRRAIKLQQLDKALGRLEAGEFGLCATCGEEISPGRLEFDPTTTLCIECATRAENQES